MFQAQAGEEQADRENDLVEAEFITGFVGVPAILEAFLRGDKGFGLASAPLTTLKTRPGGSYGCKP